MDIMTATDLEAQVEAGECAQLADDDQLLPLAHYYMLRAIFWVLVAIPRKMK